MEQKLTGTAQIGEMITGRCGVVSGGTLQRAACSPEGVTGTRIAGGEELRKDAGRRRP